MRHIYIIAFLTIIKKEIYRFTRIWVQTLIPPIITASLYFLIFGEIIGKRIGNDFGVPYIQFIAPGLIMMSIINNSYSNTVSSFFSSKFQKNIEEMQIAPVPDVIIIAGFIIGGLIRGLSIGLITLLVSSLFTDIHIANYTSLIITALTASTIFAATGLINAIYAKTFDDISAIPTFILTPLTYLGGVFYPINALPEFWRNLSYFNPIFYIVENFRESFIETNKINDTSNNLLIMTAIMIFLILFALYLFKNRSHTSSY